MKDLGGKAMAELLTPVDWNTKFGIKTGEEIEEFLDKFHSQQWILQPPIKDLDERFTAALESISVYPKKIRTISIKVWNSLSNIDLHTAETQEVRILEGNRLAKSIRNYLGGIFNSGFGRKQFHTPRISLEEKGLSQILNRFQQNLGSSLRNDLLKEYLRSNLYFIILYGVGFLILGKGEEAIIIDSLAQFFLKGNYLSAFNPYSNQYHVFVE